MDTKQIGKGIRLQQRQRLNKLKPNLQIAQQQYTFGMSLICNKIEIKNPIPNLVNNNSNNLQQDEQQIIKQKQNYRESPELNKMAHILQLQPMALQNSSKINNNETSPEPQKHCFSVNFSNNKVLQFQQSSNNKTNNIMKENIVSNRKLSDQEYITEQTQLQAEQKQEWHYPIVTNVNQLKQVYQNQNYSLKKSIRNSLKDNHFSRRIDRNCFVQEIDDSHNVKQFTSTTGNITFNTIDQQDKMEIFKKNRQPGELVILNQNLNKFALFKQQQQQVLQHIQSTNLSTSPRDMLIARSLTPKEQYYHTPFQEPAAQLVHHFNRIQPKIGTKTMNIATQAQQQLLQQCQNSNQQNDPTLLGEFNKISLARSFPIVPKPNQQSILNESGGKMTELELQKLNIFYRFRISSLLSNLGIEFYYVDEPKCKERYKQKKLQIFGYSFQSMLQRLKKIVSSKCKYRYREKLDYGRALILKTINYDLKKGLQMYENCKTFRLKKKEKKKLLKLKEKGEEKKEKMPPATASTNTAAANSNNDLDIWKRKNGVDPRAKVFIISGGYKDIKRGLKERGWVENTDKKSMCFDLKWSLKASELEDTSLMNWQMVNHFEQNVLLTNKCGLARNTRSLIWADNVDIDTFITRSYDLNDVRDFDDFIEDFKLTKVEAILKEFQLECQLHCSDKDNAISSIEIDPITQLKLKMCIDIMLRRWKGIDLILQGMANDVMPIVNKKEWEFLVQQPQNNSCFKQAQAEWLNQLNVKLDAIFGDKLTNEQQLVKTTEIIENQNLTDDDKDKGKMAQQMLLRMVNETLNIIKAQNPQYNLNGHRNIWIVKPSGLSRGRGIKCFDNLEKIINYVIVSDKKHTWIAQKYMENTMIIGNRKFDIRQWVLVTQWNPLKIYFFDECYIRFSAEDYDISQIHNRYIHLTNNSIGKYSLAFKEQPVYEKNMMTMQEFADYIAEITKQPDLFYTKIQRQFKEQVIHSLKCVQDNVTARNNNCFEHFGYDFLIDDQCNAYLVEVNSSPAMEYSSKITKRLVQEVSEDILKIVIDQKSQAGKLKCIYKNAKSYI